MKHAPAKRAIKQDRAVKTRQEILNSAIKLFAHRGILATTMADLARAIRMTPGALYWHFPTKEDLLLAAIEELHGLFMQSFMPIMVDVRRWPAAKQLEIFCNHAATFLTENRDHGIFFGLVGAEAAENNEHVAAALREALEVYIATIENILRYGQNKTKEFRPDLDARTLASTVIFAYVGLVSQHLVFKETISYLPLVQSLNTVLWTGVKNRS